MPVRDYIDDVNLVGKIHPLCELVVPFHLLWSGASELSTGIPFLAVDVTGSCFHDFPM